MTYPQPPQNPPPRKHHGVRNGLLLGFGICTAALILIVAIGAALGSGGNIGHSAATSTTSAAAAPVTTTPPVTNPDGKYSGSCDYTLNSNMYGDDHLIGEVDLTNTGNVGTNVHVRITWPQEGYAPIVKTRDVKTNPGQHLAVRFHVPVPSSGNVITQLQSWQERHNFQSGCTYNATITGTFGPVS